MASVAASCRMSTRKSGFGYHQAKGARMRIREALAIISALGMDAPAAAQEMAPIDKFIEQNAQATNAGTEVFVGLRCASLFMLISIYAGNNKMDDQAAKFKEASQSAFKFAADSQKPKNDEYLVGQVKIMLEAYKDRFLKAKALTGNFSDDPVINADMKTCLDVF